MVNEFAWRNHVDVSLIARMKLTLSNIRSCIHPRGPSSTPGCSFFVSFFRFTVVLMLFGLLVVAYLGHFSGCASGDWLGCGDTLGSHVHGTNKIL